jgi:hypothetical protein
MLRWEMGDAHFFQALKNYLTDPSIAYGYASQEKLVHHMEIAADTTLTEFFNDWYYGQGYPTYHIEPLTSQENSERQIIRISQAPSHSSVSFFEMHVPIRVWKDGGYTDLRLYHTQQDQEFMIAESAIDSIQFDPEKWLIAKVDWPVRSKQVSRDDQIQIISEPSHQRIRIILPETPEKAHLQMVDLNGRTVLTTLLREKDSYVEISTLKKGMYVVEVQTKNAQKVEKIVISH